MTAKIVEGDEFANDICILLIVEDGGKPVLLESHVKPASVEI